MFARCYRDIDRGFVFEKDKRKAATLAAQRSTWAVYCVDCIHAMQQGVGFRFSPNLIDIDPYGESWPVIDAALHGMRKFPSRLVLVVNDGLRQKLKMGGGWDVHSMAEAVKHFGQSSLYESYLDVCAWLVKEKAHRAGYQVTRWAAYHCGFQNNMTHFAAVLDR